MQRIVTSLKSSCGRSEGVRIVSGVNMLWYLIVTPGYFDFNLASYSGGTSIRRRKRIVSWPMSRASGTTSMEPMGAMQSIGFHAKHVDEMVSWE